MFFLIENENIIINRNKNQKKLTTVIAIIFDNKKNLRKTISHKINFKNIFLN